MGELQRGPGGPCPPEILVGWATMHLGPPVIGVYDRGGQLILRKISKIDACTRRQNLRLKCSQFAFRLGHAPDPAGGTYSAPPVPSCIYRAYF